jgi:hypothetical protein
MMVDINQVLLQIKDLSLPATLIYLAKLGIDSFVKPGYEKLAQAIKDKQNQKKYAFVPNKSEAIKLKEVGNTPTYNEINSLVPNYKHLSIIRTGLLVLGYNKEKTPDSAKRIGEIKMQILRNPGGKRLVKIINLTSTVFFSSVLKFLRNLKNNNYPEEHIENELDELIEDWEKSSLFVENEYDVDRVKIFCHDQADERNDRFFILALKDRAVQIVERSIEKLNQENFFRKNYYSYLVFKEDPGEIKKIEVIITRKDL